MNEHDLNERDLGELLDAWAQRFADGEEPDVKELAALCRDVDAVTKAKGGTPTIVNRLRLIFGSAAVPYVN